MQENNSRYAGYYIRVLAYLVDSAVWTIPVGIIFLIASRSAVDLPNFFSAAISAFAIILLINLIGKFIVTPFLISEYGGGIGKLLTGLRITNQNNSKLTFKNALFREYIAKVASNLALGLGYMWIFRNPEKQAWHDMISGTYVYKKGRVWIIGVIVYLLLSAANITMFVVGSYNILSSNKLFSDMAPIVDEVNKDNPLQNNTNTVPLE